MANYPGREEVRFYLREISRTKVLSREEEIRLFVRLNRGDESARTEIVEANLRFVLKIALSFAGRGVSLADLIQEGNVGLLEVISKFDYRKGYRFSTYAAFWIRQSMQLALRRQNNVIRLPIRKGRLLGQLKQKISDYTQSHGRPPTIRELSLLVDMDEQKLEHLMQLRDSVLSLDCEEDYEFHTQLADKLRDDVTPSPADHYLAKERRRQLAHVLTTLTDKEQQILKLRYGFGTGRDLSLRTTSRVVGMSQEGVRRLERKALKKLRRPAVRAMVAELL